MRKDLGKYMTLSKTTIYNRLENFDRAIHYKPDSSKGFISDKVKHQNYKMVIKDKRGDDVKNGKIILFKREDNVFYIKAD